MNKITNPTKKQIENILGRIGYSLRPVTEYLDVYFILNQFGEDTKLRLLYPKDKGRIEYDGGVNMPRMFFDLKDLIMRCDEEGVSFQAKGHLDVYLLLNSVFSSNND